MDRFKALFFITVLAATSLFAQKAGWSLDKAHSSIVFSIRHMVVSDVRGAFGKTTGTVKLKAEFPNAGEQLWPGQFVNVRLLIDTLKDVVTIPTGAVQRGPNGTFVYVIKDDSTASMRPIVVQKQDETQTVVKSGVAVGERVVTTGFVRLTDGSKVTMTTPASNSGSSDGNSGSSNGSSGSSSQANLLEQLIKLQSQYLSQSTSGLSTVA